MSRRLFLVIPLCVSALRGEVHTLALRQAIDLALKQNPDVALARLDEQKALQAVRLAKDPFVPHVNVGSGLAYVSGFPMSIEGSAPSVFQAQATAFLFNRQQKFLVQRAKETARGAGIAVSAKQDEVVFRTASLFLDAERDGRFAEAVRRQIESLEKIARTVQLRVGEGQQLPIEARRASVEIARGRQRLEQLESDQDAAEHALAGVLGFSFEHQVRPAAEERPASVPPVSEEAAVQAALSSGAELKQLESELAAKGFELRARRAARLPRVDLVAQYGLFAKFNNYEDYFRQFQRNNGELGVSFQLPLLPGPGLSAQAAQAEADAARIRIQLNATRNRIALEVRQKYRQIRGAESVLRIARQDLDLARDQVSLLLARMNEGRAPLSQVEQARAVEDDKWMIFYDAQYSAEKAGWDLLRQTGALAAAFK